MRSVFRGNRALASLLFLAVLALGGGTVAGHPASDRPTAALAQAGRNGKLYGRLAEQVAAAGPATRLRVIVHLRDQVDVSTWPAGDRPGALRALRAVAARTQPAVRSFLSQAPQSVDIYETYWIFNGFAMEAPAAT